MASQIVYSNAEKLMAVVEAWSRPLLAQLPPPYNYLAPAIKPVIGNMISRLPDEAIPQTINAIVDNAVSQGTLSLWKITLDRNDLLSLQKLIRLNLPVTESAIVKDSGYKVVTE